MPLGLPYTRSRSPLRRSRRSRGSLAALARVAGASPQAEETSLAAATRFLHGFSRRPAAGWPHQEPRLIWSAALRRVLVTRELLIAGAGAPRIARCEQNACRRMWSPGLTLAWQPVASSPGRFSATVACPLHHKALEHPVDAGYCWFRVFNKASAATISKAWWPSVIDAYVGSRTARASAMRPAPARKFA